MPALLLFAMVAHFVGCDRSGSSSDSSSSEILIGHVASMTGDTATFGVSADEGIRLALDEINAAGGVLGKKINIKTLDDRSLPDEAKTTTQRLIDDGAVALLGEIASSRSIAMAPVAQERKVPMLSPGSTNPKVTVDPNGEPRDYIFRACFTDPFQGQSIARFALNDLKLKKFAFLYPVNSDYGVGLHNYISEELKRQGAQIVADLSYNEKGDVDFRSQLTKIKSAGAEAVFCTGYYQEAGLIAIQARELGLTIPLLGCDGWDSDKTLQVGGKAVEGCFFSNHYSPDEDRPEVKKFVDGYKAKYKNPDGSPKVPDAMAVLGYDAMKLMADAIRRAGSTDGMKIRDALAGTSNFPGVAGPITMDKNHNAQKSLVIIEIKNGQFTFRTRINP